MTSLSQTLLDLCADRDLAAGDLDRAALHLLDWAGCATAALAEPVRDGLDRLFPGGGGPATRIDGRSAPLAEAVRYNAALGNVLEMDDVHRGSIAHPGDVVIPVALALAETLDAPGPEMLRAVIEGYEVMIRIAMASGTGHYRHFYTTATSGAFGAAAAASRMMGLSAKQRLDALGHAGMMAAGLWQCRAEAGEAKQMATSNAARAGLEAAQMAAAGLRAPAQILEGDLGFFAGLCPGADASLVLQEAQSWLIHQVSFKPWPACRHVHPSIEAALTLRAEGVSPAQIASVKVESYADALAFADRAMPETPHQARFSLQHCVATALLTGDITLKDSSPAALTAPGIAALRARVEVSQDPAITARYPESYGARVTARLQDGASRTAEIVNVLGDPENPLPREGILSKAHGLLSPRHGVHAPAIVEAALALPHSTTRRFGDALRGTATGTNQRSEMNA